MQVDAWVRAAGSPDWTDYALDLDVCAMRGADKGLAVRVAEGQSGIAVDLRGPGYEDVILNRREWPMGKARAINAKTSGWAYKLPPFKGQQLTGKLESLLKPLHPEQAPKNPP